jgi:endo-1,4-beta-D-glucanase Y
MAANLLELQIFQGIFNWTKENLTTEDVNKLLLSTGNEGRTVFHVAA